MFGTLLHKNFEIDNFKPAVLIPVGMHVDQYERFAQAIINDCVEIRKEVAEQEKKEQEEKQCSTCEAPCASCESEKPKE